MSDEFTNINQLLKPEIDLDNNDLEESKEYHKLTFPEHSIDKIAEALKQQHTELGATEFVNQSNIVGSFVELLKRMTDTYTHQSLFLSQVLDYIKDPSMVGDSYEHKADPEVEGDTDFALKNQVLKLDPKILKGAEISGQKAKLFILAGNRNVKRIYLYNSGFNIILRGPTLIEVNLVYNRLYEDMHEYGRMLGAIFYMYSDLKIKSIIWDFIESLVISSNLNKWDKNNRLRNCVSLLDYQSILLAIGSLMFKSGYPLKHVCINPNCRAVTEENVDLNRLQLTDFSRIPENKLRWLANSEKVSLDDVKQYKEALGNTDNILINNYKLYLKVPSMSEYIVHGSAYNDEMAMSIHDFTDSKIVDQYLKYNYSRLFEPWISHIEAIEPSDNSVLFKVADDETITLILNEIQNSDESEIFSEKINEFIQKVSVSNVGYFGVPCSSCGQEPTNMFNGFIPFDTQSSFFTMLVMRLIQNS